MNNIPKRKPIRIEDYDYSTPGAYFITVCTANRKKIFSLENIYQSIWGEAVGDSAIMVHIKNIRKKLGDNSREPTYIKTAWGRGYYVD